MSRKASLRVSFAAGLFCWAALGQANAASVTLTGTLSADDSVFTYTLANPSTQTYDFYTTSFSGGTNANGTVTPAGGFDPVLTLFSPSGSVVGFGGGGGLCMGSMTAICDDANFTETLSPGNYVLALSEFPNTAVGTLSDGFLFTGSPSITGDVCGVSGGMFLESDVAPCVQRTSSYALNIAPVPAVPEPPTWLMVLPAAGALLMFRRQFA